MNRKLIQKYNIPNEILEKIYSLDDTFRQKYDKIIIYFISYKAQIGYDKVPIHVKRLGLIANEEDPYRLKKYWKYDASICNDEEPCWISKSKELSMQMWHHGIAVRRYKNLRGENPYIRERNGDYFARYPGLREGRYMDWSDKNIKRWENGDHTYTSYMPEKYGVMEPYTSLQGER